MLNGIQQSLLNQLAALVLTTGAAACSDSVESVLSDIPDEYAEALVEQTGHGRPARHRVRLLELLSHDSRPAVLIQVAQALDSTPPSFIQERQDVLERLLQHPNGAVRNAAIDAATSWLAHSSELQRIEVLAAWATSEQAMLRTAVARLLVRPFEYFAAQSTLEHLVRDIEPSVRAAAASALSVRFSAAPDLCNRLAWQLARDPVKSVRRKARKALRRVAT